MQRLRAEMLRTQSSAIRVSICTRVLVKQVNSVHLRKESLKFSHCSLHDVLLAARNPVLAAPLQYEVYCVLLYICVCPIYVSAPYVSVIAAHNPVLAAPLRQCLWRFL